MEKKTASWEAGRQAQRLLERMAGCEAVRKLLRRSSQALRSGHRGRMSSDGHQLEQERVRLFLFYVSSLRPGWTKPCTTRSELRAEPALGRRFPGICPQSSRIEGIPYVAFRNIPGCFPGICQGVL